ncbi:MAG TPA: aldo/keto reductase [Acidimicrobiales bacterium]|nr:aldo/keto reductase [Acidimicrobiales bacterium]
MTTRTTRPIEASGSYELGSLRVHRLGYGTMQLTGRGVWGPPSDHDGAVHLLRRAAELGVDLFDTADSYGPAVAEDLLREALHPYDGLTIATKAGLVRTGPGRWSPVGRPEYLRQQCEMSLRRLGVERIDLFQLHRIDPQVPAAEQFGLLAELRREGKVAEVGLSEVTVADVQAASEQVPVVSVQNLYNLNDRHSEAVLRHCETHAIGFIPWFPVANGKLAGGASPLGRLSSALGATPAQVALAWLLQRSPVMLPIPGTSSLAHLEENCAAAELRLEQAHMEQLTSART